MNGKFRTRHIASRDRRGIDPQEIAIRALGAIAGDGERLETFLALTGLQPDGLRHAAASPDFLAAVLDHVVADEPLLLAIAAELDVPPESVLAAQLRLSPPSDEP